MTNVRTLARSFGGGEVTPEFFGRVDDVKFQTGLALCRNFIVYPHGPIANRPGSKLVRAAKTTNKRARLIPFEFSDTQTFALEFGDQYIRFHTLGGTVLLSGSPYEVTTPYLEADLFNLHYVQSADVLTIVHPNYAPRELRRLGATNWTLTTISFASSLAAPGSPVATPTPSTGAISYSYKITAVGANGIEEGPASAAANTTNAQLSSTVYNTITFAAVTGAVRYNIYKQSNGLYGFIGQTDALTFRDDNINADLSKTPPQLNNPFNAAGDYPAAVSYFEQRRWFGGTTNKPQNVWGTRSGTESDMSFSIPTRDDDAVSIRISARQVNAIRHLVPLNNLLPLTSSAEFRITSINTDAITPSSISVKPQSYVGASNVQPVIVNNNLIYGAARGGHMRELAFNWQAQGYVTGDLSLRAPHLFDGLTIVDMAFQKSPQPVIWAVSSNGKLLGFTYVPEQSIGAWHQHDSYQNDPSQTVNGVPELQGFYESVTVVTENDDDVLYAIVRRRINGTSSRFVERFQPRRFTDSSDAFFVDCGATYDGSPTTTITGLTWLVGQTVNVLAQADGFSGGAVHPPVVVSNIGTITLEYPIVKAQIGLPITADMTSLPLSFEAQAAGQGRTKNINSVWLRVYRSSGIFAGPSFDALTPFKQRTFENPGNPPDLKSEEIEIKLSAMWQHNGSLFVRQTDPLPLTLISFTLDTAVGA